MSAGFEELELEDAQWELSLASLYREAQSETPSPVLERCIDRLEKLTAEDWEQTLVIEEEVPRPRGLLPRLALAWSLDLSLVVGLSASIGAVPLWARFAFGAIAGFSYFTLSGVLGGRTLGDRLAGVRTIDSKPDGRLGLFRAALRSLLTVVSAFSLVGLFWSLIDGAGQTLPDRILGTRTLPYSDEEAYQP